MICPLKFSPATLGYLGGLAKDSCQCEKGGCELWIERFGRCALAVDAYLKGQEDWLREKGVKE